jgi:hypothetical protein
VVIDTQEQALDKLAPVAVRRSGGVVEPAAAQKLEGVVEVCRVLVASHVG